MQGFRYKEMKIWWHDAGHMTKMATMPIYGKKPFKNLLLQNRLDNFHETWYVASGTPAHQKLFKWWPWSDLDLFYSKVKFGNFWIFQKLLQPVTWKLVDADN